VTGSTAPAENLAGFLGFTALVLTGFLVLARLSQGVVGDGEDAEPGESASIPAGPVSERPAHAEPETRADAGDLEGSNTESHRRSGTENHGRSDAEDHERTDAETHRRPDARETGRGDSDGASDAAGPSQRTGPAETEATGARHEPATEVSPAANRDPATPNHESAAAWNGSAATGNEHAVAGHEPVVAGNARESIPPAALLANVALTQGLFGGILAAAAWFFQVPGTALGLAGGRVEGVAAVAIGLAFGTVLWVGNEVATALADAAGAGYDEGLRQLLAPGTARGWAILLGGVLPVIALVEEFLFRAAAIGAAGATVGATGPTAAGAWALAVVSSLAFALGHGAQGRVGVVVTGALGFVLAAGFVLSGSFLVVVVAHYVVNAMEFLVHEWAGLPDPVWS
jgi:membrane protease YdiL (CAAX protease family)